MLETIKNGFFAGLGAMVITKKKADEVLERLVEQGKITSQEARDIAEELSVSGRQELERYRDSFTEAVGEAVSSLDVAGKRRQDELAGKVEDLEKRLAMAEDRLQELESQGASSTEEDAG